MAHSSILGFGPAVPGSNPGSSRSPANRQYSLETKPRDGLRGAIELHENKNFEITLMRIVSWLCTVKNN